MLIMSMIVIALFLLLSDFTGWLAIRNKQCLITIPLGAVIFFSGFQLLALPFMAHHARFDWFLMSVGIVVIGIYSLLFIKYRQYFKQLAHKFHNRYYLITLFIALCFGLLLAYLSLPLSDSWLYGPMTLSSITNNLIYSSNGVSVGGDIISYHGYDGYYLFQSVLISLIPGDDYVVMMSVTKVIEGVLIITSVAWLCNQVFTNQRANIFAILSACLVCGISLFTIYPQLNEIRDHSFMSMAIGINLFNNVIVIIFGLIVVKLSQQLSLKILLPIIINACFFLSSSSLFVCCAFLITYIIMQVIRSEKGAIQAGINGLAICGLYAVIYFVDNQSLWFWLLLIVVFIIAVIINLAIKYLPMKIIKVLTVIGCCIFIGFNIIYLIKTNQLVVVITNMFSFKQSLIYPNSTPYYFNFYNPLMLVLVILGLYWLKKSNNNLFIYSLIFIGLWANPISYQVIGSIVSQEVYHRIFNLFLPNLIFIYLLYFVLEKVKFNYTQYTPAILALIILIIKFPMFNNIFTGFDSYQQYKYQNQDLELLAHYDYPLTHNINFGLQGENKITGELEIDALMRTRGDLNLVDCSNQEPFYYIVSNKITNINLDPVYQTPNFNVYYIDGAICQIK